MMRPVAGSLTSIVLLAAWLGAAVLVAAVVAPAAFAVLPTRTLAGALVGRVLPVVFWSGMVVGLVVAALGWSTTGSTWRIGAGLAIALSSAIAQLGITPKIEAIRASVGGPIDALDPTDPRRQAFGRLHGMSVAWMGVGAIAATIALVMLVRAVSRSSP